MITANELRRRFIDFFVNKHEHKEIKSASLIPENDPTVLFTTAGMHPLVPFLMGEKHPDGVKLVDSQKCVRTDDIDEVGDETHCTFFEMLGNWSLGDYFKEEAIAMAYEFLTTRIKDGGLGIEPDRLVVSCFDGDDDAPKDVVAIEAWKKLGFTPASEAKPGQRKLIYFYGKKDNWWGPAGQTGPCGPDSEIFYDVEDGDIKEGEQPSDDGGRFVEIWNNVFMEYFRNDDGSYSPLKQKNIDTGMGLERVLAILNGKKTHYETELFLPVMEKIDELSRGGEISLSGEDVVKAKRIIADHLRASVFILGDPWGVSPSNTDQGYILRRLIRRAIRYGKQIGISGDFLTVIAEIFIDIYKDAYPELVENRDKILHELAVEEAKFGKTIEKGFRELNKFWNLGRPAETPVSDGEKAFFIYETYGFPYEMIVEELTKHGYKIDFEAFLKSFKEAERKHQEMSKAGAEQKFSGGLVDHSEETTKLHTATHLLHKALKIVLGEDVKQRGSNITHERLRFDFNYPEKMTPEQIKEVERIVNEQIEKGLEVKKEMMSVDEAKKSGAVGLFDSKYGDTVSVYSIGDFSKEICGGPHVSNTSEIGGFKIKKEQSSSAGVRRIKAVIG